MMDPQEVVQWYYYLSDTFWYSVAVAAVTDFKLLTLLCSGPLVWAVRKYTNWTPWTTDDKLGDMIEKKLGITK